MPLLNYTTQIAAERTVSEIEAALAKAGASHVMKEFDPVTGQPSGLIFRIATSGGVMNFKLPCRADSALKILNRQAMNKKIASRFMNNREQAIRVAWRIVREWTLAQLALIELEQADAAEMFLAFATGRNGKTLYENIGQLKNDGLLQITNG